MLLNGSDDNMLLTVDLTNPNVYFETRLLLPKDTIHIVRTIFLSEGIAHQRIVLRNHGEHAAGINLSLAFGNDFADLFEVRYDRHSLPEACSASVDAGKRICSRRRLGSLRSCHNTS
jgi:glycogen debranching enzyme